MPPTEDPAPPNVRLHMRVIGWTAATLFGFALLGPGGVIVPILFVIIALSPRSMKPPFQKKRNGAKIQIIDDGSEGKRALRDLRRSLQGGNEL